MLLTFNEKAVETATEAAEKAAELAQQRNTIYDTVRHCHEGHGSCFFSDIWQELLERRKTPMKAVIILDTLAYLVETGYLTAALKRLHTVDERPCYKPTDKVWPPVTEAVASLPILPFFCEEVKDIELVPA